MRVLAFDTALGSCSAGLWDSETGAACQKTEDMRTGHAERLLPLVEEVLSEAGTSWQDIGLVAVTNGPGSFTGLRVGLAAARSLGLSLNVPVRAASTTETLAGQYFEAGENGAPLAVLLETKRSDYYFQMFAADGEAAGAPEAIDGPGASEKMPAGCVLIGDAAQRFAADNKAEAFYLKTGYSKVDPVFLARRVYMFSVDSSEASFPSPLYLRNADVSLSKSIPRRIGI